MALTLRAPGTSVRSTIEAETGESLAESEFFLHGTTADVAQSFELQARPFHTTVDPAVARMFAVRSVEKAGRGEVGAVALVLPRPAVAQLKALGQLKVGPISDMPQHLEWVFAPGARETILKQGTIIPLKAGSF